MNRLICGDVLDVLRTEDSHYTCLIADPPDNIGLEYDGYNDNRNYSDYEEWFDDLVTVAASYADVSWISFNARHIFMVGEIIDRAHYHFPEHSFRLFIQTFTFGQNRQTDCGNGYRPLLRIMRPGAKLYPDAIRVPSQRQLSGDKRADPRGRVPLDIWDFPRVTGNCKERRSWHPTQLREAMIQRIVDFSTLPGERVCDAFSGTGTVLRAIKDRSVTSIELSREYCDRIAAEHGLGVETV